MKLSRGLVGGLMAMGVLTACGKAKEDEKAAPVAENLQDLKLSSALQIKLPDGLNKAAGATATTALTSGKKSFEACRVFEETERLIEKLNDIGSTFCHLEAESAQMKFGVKYNLTFTGGGNLEGDGDSGPSQIWVDNSKAGTLSVYMCKANALRTVFSITGFTGEDGKIKGTLKNSYNESHNGQSNTGGVDIEFDFTTAGLKLVKGKLKSEMSGSFTGSYMNDIDLKIMDTGVSMAKMSRRMSAGEGQYEDKGAMYFNGTMGQAMFVGRVGDGTTGDILARRSTFDANGNLVANTTAVEEIKVKLADLPAVLAADFAPAAPTGWDCVADTTATVNLASAAHTACNQREKLPEGGTCTDANAFETAQAE
jgi:hypothetical protein